MKKMSDKSKILNHLMRGESLTFHSAERLFDGCVSLRERIRDLRQEGINIVSEKCKNKRTGRYHTRYFLIGAGASGA